MELIFIKEPIIGILALVIAALDLISGLSARGSAKVLPTLLSAVNILLHAACLTLILLLGGGYEGALMLVLMSCVITLAASPKPTAGVKPSVKDSDGNNNDSEVKA